MGLGWPVVHGEQKAARQPESLHSFIEENGEVGGLDVPVMWLGGWACHGWTKAFLPKG